MVPGGLVVSLIKPMSTSVAGRGDRSGRPSTPFDADLDAGAWTVCRAARVRFLSVCRITFAGSMKTITGGIAILRGAHGLVSCSFLIKRALLIVVRADSALSRERAFDRRRCVECLRESFNWPRV